MDVNKDEILNEIDNGNPWERVVLKEDVEFDTIVKIASHQDKFPNIDWEDASVRVYNFSEMFAHVVGYVGSISQRRVPAAQDRRVQALPEGREGRHRKAVSTGSSAARTGTCAASSTCASGPRAKRSAQPPVAGNNLVLTIDYNIQNALYDAMKDMKGAAIVHQARDRRGHRAGQQA